MCYMVCLVVLIFVSKLNIGGLYIEEWMNVIWYFVLYILKRIVKIYCCSIIFIKDIELLCN